MKQKNVSTIEKIYETLFLKIKKILQDKKNFADMIKGHWGGEIILEYSSGTSEITWVFKIREIFLAESERWDQTRRKRNLKHERDLTGTNGFEDGRRNEGRKEGSKQG